MYAVFGLILKTKNFKSQFQQIPRQLCLEKKVSTCKTPEGRGKTDGGKGLWKWGLVQWEIT